MTTAIDAAAAIGRANTDLVLGLASVIQATNQRWFELSSRVASEAVRGPSIDKAYWDEITAVATETRAAGFNNAQKAVADWQSCCSDAVREIESPFKNTANLASIFQAWLPVKPSEDAKAPAKTKAPAANG